MHLRRILVYSPANAAGQAKARALKLAKATEDLNRLVRTAGTRFHPTPTPSLPGSRRSPPNAASGCTCAPRSPEAPSASRYCPGTSTRPRSAPEAAADGWDALLTNLAPGPAGQEEAFRRHKGQHVVERRYGEFKGPLAVAPLFLKTNRRITARYPRSHPEQPTANATRPNEAAPGDLQIRPLMHAMRIVRPVTPLRAELGNRCPDVRAVGNCLKRS